LNPTNLNSLAPERSIWVIQDEEGLGALLTEEFKSRGYNAQLQPKVALLSEEERPKIGGLVIFSGGTDLHDSIWQVDDESMIKDTFLVAKSVLPDLHEAAQEGGAIFTTISCLDGKFGLEEQRTFNPVYGGIAALSKTIAQESPNINCHAIDIDPTWPNWSAPKLIVDEILNGTSIETSFYQGERYELEMFSSDIDVDEKYTQVKSNLLEEDDVLIITGGARGVTATVAKYIGEEFQPTLVLLGRSKEPFEEPLWLPDNDDPSLMKKTIMQNHFVKDKGDDKNKVKVKNENKDTTQTNDEIKDKILISPLELEKVYHQYKYNREINRNLSQLRNTGARVIYRSIDIRDNKATNKLFKEIKKQYGPIKGIIHAAGVIEDRLITDKSFEQFEKVFDTKVVGLRNLLININSDELIFLVLFSSVSARLGNSGQVDYAMANEILNKTASWYRLHNPECKTFSVNWGPWNGGMVTESLKKIFQKKGVGLIDIQEGAKYLIQEMGNPQFDSEIIIGNTLNNKPDDDWQLTMNQEVSLANYPILKSHIIGGYPVVPLALMIEWMIHACLQVNREWHFHGLNNIQVLNGIRLKDDNSANITVYVKTIGIDHNQNTLSNSENIIYNSVEVMICDADRPVQTRIHAKATIVLVNEIPPPPSSKGTLKGTNLQKFNHSTQTVYKDILFHGEDMQYIDQIHGYSEQGIKARIKNNSTPQPQDWNSEPFTDHWICNPAFMDSAFQTSILWGFENKDLLSLPIYASSYRQYCKKFPDSEVVIDFVAQKVESNILKGNFFFLDDKGKVLATIVGFEGVMDPSLQEAFRN